MRRVALLAVGLPMMFATLPANADTGIVKVSYVLRYNKVGSGYVVVAACDAMSDPGITGHVPVATSVSCTINGFTQSAVAPGPTAAVVVATATSAPIRFCRTGTGTFIDFTTSTTYPVTAGPTCVDFPGIQ